MAFYLQILISYTIKNFIFWQKLYNKIKCFLHETDILFLNYIKTQIIKLFIYNDILATFVLCVTVCVCASWILDLHIEPWLLYVTVQSSGRLDSRLDFNLFILNIYTLICAVTHIKRESVIYTWLLF